MKIIKYQLMTEVNHGTEDEPNIVQTFSPCEIRCSESVFESNLVIAKREAYGEVSVDDDGQPEPTPEPTIWDELAAAYIEGVNEA